MKKELRISPHYICEYGTTVTAYTENICSVIDKMIRLTAKLTELYASDIYYDIIAIDRAVEEKRKLDCILFFRENGVKTKPMEYMDADEYETTLSNFTPIQTWRLTHDPATTETKLERVDMYIKEVPENA